MSDTPSTATVVRLRERLEEVEAQNEELRGSVALLTTENANLRKRLATVERALAVWQRQRLTYAYHV